MTDSPTNNSDKPSWLQQHSARFTPVEPEFRLQQQSAKLVFSSRLFPEWVVAAYGIFKQRYPDEPINSASELIGLILQDYISQGYDRIGHQMPSTQVALDFLVENAFVNPDSREQFRRLSKASDLSTRYEGNMLASTSLKDQYEYYKNRDPQKAEEILAKMTQQFVDSFDAEPEGETKKPWDNVVVPEEELVKAKARAKEGLAGAVPPPREEE